ncbi:MAG TPA: hypothetical protein DD417_19200 [Elusimicrobia bacterium]|nr:hypothetical protein [Elusimicrobiota bacterium]
MAEVLLTIDGRQVSVPEGTLVIEAARGLGIEIPHYCYHPGLSNPGVCRLCMVQVEGLPKPQVACRLTARAGMVVKTDSALARRAQASSLELQLANHPLDCPVCDQAGECMLQDYYEQYGLYASMVREDKEHKPKRVDIGAHVMLDVERCIQCTRCTRFVDEVTKTNELGIFQRGDRGEIGLAPGLRLDNPYSGNVVDLCPVGALTDKDFRFLVRVWYLEKMPSVCPGCARCCSIEVHTNTRRSWHAGGRRVARLKPRPDPRVNGYWICDEGRYGFASVDAPTRLRAPSALRDGGLRRLPWDDALRGAAFELANLCRERGSEGLAVFLSGTLSNEALAAAKALFVDRLHAGHVLVSPGPEQLGEEDALLRRREKVPNLRGAGDLGFGAAIRESSPETVLEGLRSGKIWGVYAAGRDPVAALGPGSEEALAKLAFTAQQAANADGFTKVARWVLPACAWTEDGGTYTNCEGTPQPYAPALPPLGESRPGCAILEALLASAGGPR